MRGSFAHLHDSKHWDFYGLSKTNDYCIYWSDEDGNYDSTRVTYFKVPSKPGLPDAASWHITAYPNPCDEKTVLTFDNCTTSRMKIQVCSTDGTIVQEEESPAVDGLQQYALYLPSLSPGMYVVRLSCPALGWTGSVNVVKTGAVQGAGNFDLKKIIGR